VENIEILKSPEVSEFVKKYSPYFHEARRRLYLVLWSFGISTILGFVFYEEIIKFLLKTLSLEGVNIVFTSPFQFINLAISCGFSVGLVISMPLLTHQILHFLKPALKFKEYRTVLKFLPLSLFLFLFGFAFGALIMRWQIEIFLERSISLGIGNILDVSGLLTTVFMTSAIMGLGFQFPIILLLLLRLKLISHKTLSATRKWVYLGSFLFSMLLPPDSILADVLLTLPMIILFESTIFINKMMEIKKKI